jgi:hypothetical protein
MPLSGFEPTIPVFKRAKTFHALDRAATVTGIVITYPPTIDYSKTQDQGTMFLLTSPTNRPYT